MLLTHALPAASQHLVLNELVTRHQSLYSYYTYLIKSCEILEVAGRYNEATDPKSEFSLPSLDIELQIMKDHYSEQCGELNQFSQPLYFNSQCCRQLLSYNHK